MILALIGNQNSGKTTLFNQLTGANQHVGNFPGVTVDGKSGKIKDKKYANVDLIDLPGIYSLSPYSSEEIVTRDCLTSGKVDAIINIVDASNIERNLYLSMQLIQMNIPMVIALNMMDEVEKNGGSIDIKGMESELGVDVVPISAVKNEGVSELIERVVETAAKKRLPEKTDLCDGACHRAIHSVAISLEDHAERIKVPARFAAIKLIEGDEPMENSLNLSDNEKELLEHTVKELENETGLDKYCAIASSRYEFIEKVCNNFVIKPSLSKERLRSEKIDKVLTHKIWGLPLFFGIMFLVFWLTFGVIGSFLSDLLSSGIDFLSGVVDNALTNYGMNPAVHSLIIDGIFTGIGSVLSFLPIIVVLFFFLSILEDSGYMTRVAFIMDRLLRRIGLSGKSFVPMLIGFGCTVPAVMSARTLTSERDRKMTIFLLPFFSCSAKLPIYAVFAAAFFPKYSALVMMALYVLGILVAIVFALIAKNTKFKGSPIPFIMELPNYRFPSFKTTILLMWEKAKDFLVRAFTVIFLATIIVWFLQSFDFRLNFIGGSDYSESSILGKIGQFLAPIFKPLGFGTWQSATALIAGLTAKETVISTLAVLSGATIDTLGATLSTMFTPLSAVSFLVFTLLYTPCFAAVKTINMELKSKSATALLVVMQIAIAYITSLLVFQIGSLIF